MRKKLENRENLVTAVEKSQKEELEKLAQKEDRSMSYYVRKGIEEIIKEKKEN